VTCHTLPLLDEREALGHATLLFEGGREMDDAIVGVGRATQGFSEFDARVTVSGGSISAADVCRLKACGRGAGIAPKSNAPPVLINSLERSCDYRVRIFRNFVGFVFRYFLERSETYDVKKLSAVLGIPLGSTLLVFLKDFGANSRPAYTLGLVLGLVLYQGFYAPFHLPFRRRRAGLLTRTEVHDVITIADATGRNATWIRTQTLSFNRNCKDVLISKTGGPERSSRPKYGAPAALWNWMSAEDTYTRDFRRTFAKVSLLKSRWKAP
jgi:hypothetical protein